LAAKGEGPFFLHFCTAAVHIPHVPPAFFHDGTTRVAGTTGLPHSDMIYSLDLTVGALVAKLDELNVLRNSIVVRAVRHVNVPVMTDYATVRR